MSTIPIKYNINNNNLTLKYLTWGFGGSNIYPYKISVYYANNTSNYLGITAYKTGINILPSIGSSIKLSDFIGKQSLPYFITNFSYLNVTNYNLNGTTYPITTSAGWMSGDANNSPIDGYNYRTAYGSARKVVQVANLNLRARPGQIITMNTRMGQSGFYSGYKCQFWFNNGNGYILMAQNINISVSNGSSSVGSFTIPINTPEGNYAIASSLSTLQLTSLNATTLANNYVTYRITVDVYNIQIYI